MRAVAMLQHLSPYLRLERLPFEVTWALILAGLGGRVAPSARLVVLLNMSIRGAGYV
jgi:hypothetical protein